MASDGPTRKKLALAIIDYLNTSVEDGTLSSEDRDSIDVATNCIAESFKVDPTDKKAVADALGSGQNLLSIYTVYEKLRGKNTEGASSASQSAPKTPAASSATPNAEAESFKGQGNVAMQQKDYQKAVDCYSKAIDLTPTNPIYLSNRAAAYSAMKQHDLAKQDAEMAVAADPKYTKAWSRLGLARFALGDAKGSMEAYKSGIDAEANGGSDAMRKGYETAKARVEAEGGDDEDEEDDVGNARGPPAAGGGGGMPDLSSLASMFGGGGAGGGGMPDIGAMMQNPMMRQMAQNMMSNPNMMSNLMNNPRLREMASSFGGGGGGMPDIGAMMQDPSIAEM